MGARVAPFSKRKLPAASWIIHESRQRICTCGLCLPPSVQLKSAVHKSHRGDLLWKPIKWHGNFIDSNRCDAVTAATTRWPRCTASRCDTATGSASCARRRSSRPKSTSSAPKSKVSRRLKVEDFGLKILNGRRWTGVRSGASDGR